MKASDAAENDIIMNPNTSPSSQFFDLARIFITREPS